MKHPLLLKLLAVAGTFLVLSGVLARIGFLVDERRGYQWEALQSVQRSHSGAQTLIGPLLQRACSERWTVSVGQDKERRTELQRRDFVLQLAPAELAVTSSSTTELRYRGLFKVNGYVAQLHLEASFPELQALQARREQPGSEVICDPATLWLATSDVRGLRQAKLSVNGQALAVLPGTLHPTQSRGLHAVIDPLLAAPTAPAAGAPLRATLTLELIGTQQLALVPAADALSWKHRADWPHPSFGGRFLPTEREVTDHGFSARWSLTSLASSAAADVMAQGQLCDSAAGANSAAATAPHAPVQPPRPCLDTLAVDFIDPVNSTTLSDRAIKYGLLFVALTFVAVGLTESLARGRVRRVHPVQYALVGLVLCLFFLLLLSLSEHLAFATAYAVASTACVALLGVYARHMLGRWRDGLAFAAGMGVLYALVYVLLQREHDALVVGSLALFGALATVMLITRRVDWYALTQPRPARSENAT